MPQVIKVCDVEVGDLIGIEGGSTLEVVNITPAKTEAGNVLSLDFDDGSTLKELAPEDKILLLCRPAV